LGGGLARVVLSVMIGSLLVTACEPAQSSSGPSVIRVLGSWEGPELAAFQAVVAPFEERTGYQIDYTSTRNLRGVLEMSFEAGHPPDLAGLPGPGFMLELARQGRLMDLSDVLDVRAYKRETAPDFVDLGTIDGRLMGAFIKGTVKGLLWYDPSVFRLGTPATWAELQLTAMNAADGIKPWCVGLASDASSGWPGTDWIEGFVLRQGGPEVYDGWVAGTVPWTSPAIRRAFQAFGTVVADGAVAGGVDGVLRTHFSHAPNGLFTDPPQCLFVHQASFMKPYMEQAAETLGGAYEIMPFPDIDPRFSGAIIGAGDLVALTNDSPGGRELIRYLVGAEAQSIWVSQGGALSANLTVTDYPDRLSREEAQLLGSARVFRFDASDTMPEGMNEAFWQAVLDFTADQDKLDDILVHLDAVQALEYSGAG
jgi:alpha-glucoside transport system substrate-binding protein